MKCLITALGHQNTLNGAEPFQESGVREYGTDWRRFTMMKLLQTPRPGRIPTPHLRAAGRGEADPSSNNKWSETHKQGWDVTMHQNKG